METHFIIVWIDFVAIITLNNYELWNWSKNRLIFVWMVHLNNMIPINQPWLFNVENRMNLLLPHSDTVSPIITNYWTTAIVPRHTFCVGFSGTAHNVSSWSTTLILQASSSLIRNCDSQCVHSKKYHSKNRDPPPTLIFFLIYIKTTI